MHKFQLHAWGLVWTLVIVLQGMGVSQIGHYPNPLNMTAVADSLDTKLEIYFTNSKDTTYNVYWKLEKDASTWQQDWSTYICDLEVCYNINQDKSSPNLPNKFKKGTHKFEFHFLPKGIPGCSKLTLKLYSDKNFTQELYSCDININNCPVGIYHTPNPLTMTASKDTLDKKLEITFTNTRDTLYNVFWKLEKDASTWNPAWSTYICDLEVCYNLNQDKNSPNLPNKFTKGSHKFEFHFLPNGTDGCTILKLRLYGDKNFTQEIYSATININNCVSSSTVHQLPEVLVYPNPASQTFSVSDVPPGQQILLINSTGSIIKTWVSGEDSQFDISDVARGMYFVMVKNSTSPNAAVTKLVID